MGTFIKLLVLLFLGDDGDLAPSPPAALLWDDNEPLLWDDSEPSTWDRP